jgi:hypothetical protein
VLRNTEVKLEDVEVHTLGGTGEVSTWREGIR